MKPHTIKGLVNIQLTLHGKKPGPGKGGPPETQRKEYPVTLFVLAARHWPPPLNLTAQAAILGKPQR